MCNPSRLTLFQILSALPAPQFEHLRFSLNPPPGIVPENVAPQGNRVAALLSWVEGSTGCGLDRLYKDLEEVHPGVLITDASERAEEVAGEPARFVINSHTHKDPDELELDYSVLSSFLENQQWGDADFETYQLLLLAAGQQECNWLKISDVEKISSKIIQKIDRLWALHSGRKFGFTAQKNIWHKLSGGKVEDVKGIPFERFKQLVGWAESNCSPTKYPTPVDYTQLTFNIDAVPGHLPTFGRDRLSYTDWAPSFKIFLRYISTALQLID